MRRATNGHVSRILRVRMMKQGESSVEHVKQTNRKYTYKKNISLAPGVDLSRPSLMWNSRNRLKS